MLRFSRLCKCMALIVFILLSLGCSLPSEIEEQWGTLLKVSKVYSESCRNYWTSPEFNAFKEHGSGVIAFLNKKYVESSTSQEREIALHLIGEITKNQEVVWSIFKNPDETGLDVSVFVMWYLRFYKNPEFIDFCRKKLWDSNEIVRLEALETHIWQGAVSWRELLTWYEQYQDNMAIIGIGQLGDRTAIPKLRELMQDGNTDALLALGLLREPDAVAMIYRDLYLIDRGRYTDFRLVRGVLEGVRTREVIDWLMEDATQNVISLIILTHIKDGTSGYEIALEIYDRNSLECERDLQNLRAWWEASREEWETPKQRIVILEGLPAIGEPPEDVLWIDVWKDMY
jgi:hypothetical protein